MELQLNQLSWLHDRLSIFPNHFTTETIFSEMLNMNMKSEEANIDLSNWNAKSGTGWHCTFRGVLALVMMFPSNDTSTTIPTPMRFDVHHIIIYSTE